jgi:dienelactone hydrolase
VRRFIPLATVLVAALTVLADGPRDNNPDTVRPVPPPGIMVEAAVKDKLLADADEIDRAASTLQRQLQDKKSPLANLIDDVSICSHAVRVALTHDEIFDAKELKSAETLLQLGKDRLTQLKDGKAPWTTSPGLHVRAYRSKIDGSLQPYGLVVPASYSPTLPHRWRLDVWCHGRGEKLTELSFLADRMKNPGAFTPRDAIVLHLYGRFCNANKFAGEIDCLEALDAVQKGYAIDPNRRVIRGFSMGGAACWQFAVHYPDLWAAAAPGAGFCETAEFLNFFQSEKIQPTAWEKTLFHWYDCPDWVGNLYDVPTVAYSGEIDKQKQAADRMAKAADEAGLHLTHLIGPKTEHAYHPQTKRELDERIDAIVAKGRNPAPPIVRFTTYTLRYSRCFWVEVERLGKHWEQATVEAHATESGLKVTTKNVMALRFKFAPGEAPFAQATPPTIEIDGKTLKGPAPNSDRSWEAFVEKDTPDTDWVRRPGPASPKDLVKKPGLTGPIDDAFLDSFLIVKPKGESGSAEIDKWVDAEMNRAIREWRRQFRGEPRVKEADAVTPEDIARHHLILWGTPKNNPWIAKALQDSPLTWDAQTLKLGGRSFEATHVVPLLIRPSALNRERYVVLNSGFTYREYDYLNNARQVSKLPDWAFVDVRTPPDSRFPGKVLEAGFFDDHWQVGK